MLGITSAITHTNPAKRFVQKYLNVVMLFFPVTSFLLVPAIQGTTIPTVLISLLFMLMVFLQLGQNKPLLYQELLQFFTIILILSFITQLINVTYRIKLNSDLILVDAGNDLDTFFRVTHITQTLYLIVSFLLYIIVKHFSDGSIIKYLYWALRLLCIYALYEVVYFKLTGQSGDFVTNRTFGEDKSGSLVQMANVGGFTTLRVKGYTGEPSMFTFTVVPFWILSFALKRWFDNILLLICLVLTVSTTAYASIALFVGFWFLYKKQYKLLIFFGLTVMILVFVLQLDAFKETLDALYNSVFGDKIDDSASSRQRGGAFERHINFWTDLNIFSQLFGIGFGYIRSTDFLSTLLVNNGILGVMIFSIFTFRNFKLNMLPKELGIIYKVGLFVLFLIMMATVPEFSYPSLWIYLALGFVLQKETAVQTDFSEPESLKKINRSEVEHI